MGSIYNVGVLLAFSFAITEFEEVYQRIYDTFLKKLSIDLSKYIFESDQGRALNTFFTKNSIKNLVCNRHLLVSLQKNIFSFQIGNIVKCRNQLDLDTCFCLYSDEFEKFLIDYKEQHGEKAHDDMKKQLNIILEKVGLTFSDKIEIAQKKRWKQVSLYEQIKKVMPSTTNSLESSHGHMNAEVPRRQKFSSQTINVRKWYEE